MIVIIGGGIAGLSLGYELTRLGERVTICEANTIASGASGVATSYLEPRLGETAMRKLEKAAHRAWPEYASQLHDVTKIDPGLRTDGQLRVTLEENVEKFSKDLKARIAQGWNVSELSLTDLKEQAPALSSKIVAAAFLPDVAWVNGLAVCQALAAGIVANGSQVLENWAVNSVETNSAAVRLTSTTGQVLDADKLVLCNGMGANTLSGLPKDIPQSRPVRGVNLVLENDSANGVTHLIKHHRGTICPRNTPGERQLIVGTTYEPGETSLDVGGDLIEKLYQNAEPILPNIRSMKLLRITAGLRTKVGDGNLCLGRSAVQPNIYFSLSHAGAGYLRMPIVAPEMAQFVSTDVKGKMSGYITRN